MKKTRLWLYLLMCCTGTPFWKLVLKQFDDLLVKVMQSYWHLSPMSPVHFLNDAVHACRFHGF